MSKLYTIHPKGKGSYTGTLVRETSLGVYLQGTGTLEDNTKISFGPEWFPFSAANLSVKEAS